MIVDLLFPLVENSRPSSIVSQVFFFFYHREFNQSFFLALLIKRRALKRCDALVPQVDKRTAENGGWFTYRGLSRRKLFCFFLFFFFLDGILMEFRDVRSASEVPIIVLVFIS